MEPGADEMEPGQDRDVIEAWKKRGRRRTVEQDGMGWWVARDLGVMVARRKYTRGLAEHLKGLR